VLREIDSLKKIDSLYSPLWRQVTWTLQ